MFFESAILIPRLTRVVLNDCSQYKDDLFARSEPEFQKVLKAHVLKFGFLQYFVAFLLS